MPQVAAERIRVPVPIVHNQDERCNVSPFALAGAFAARLTAVPAVKFIPVSGGTFRRTGPSASTTKRCRGSSGGSKRTEFFVL